MGAHSFQVSQDFRMADFTCGASLHEIRNVLQANMSYINPPCPLIAEPIASGYRLTMAVPAGEAVWSAIFDRLAVNLHTTFTGNVF